MTTDSTATDAILKQLQKEGLAESENIQLVPAAGTVEPGPSSVHTAFEETRAEMAEQANGPAAVYRVPEALPLEYVERLLEKLDRANVESYAQADIQIKFDIESRRESRATAATGEHPKW